MLYNSNFLILIVIGVIGMIVQWKLRSVFSKYSKITFSGGMTGREVAEKMLRDNGITDVKVTQVNGRLTDHYNPTAKTVNLSQGVYESNSVSAAAVAAHECGHAIQHAKGYAPLKLRSALVPVTQLSSQWAFLFLIGGVIIMTTTTSSGEPSSMSWIFWVGIAMLGVSALFSIVTLPVEYNASNRALVWLEDQRMLTREQHGQAKEALSWAARTYLVAAISAVATIVYYLGFARRD